MVGTIVYASALLLQLTLSKMYITSAGFDYLNKYLEPYCQPTIIFFVSFIVLGLPLIDIGLQFIHADAGLPPFYHHPSCQLDAALSGEEKEET